MEYLKKIEILIDQSIYVKKILKCFNMDNDHLLSNLIVAQIYFSLKR